MKKVLLGLAVFAVLLWATAGSKIDFTTGTTPGNPASGKVRLWANSGSGNLECLNSSGGSCFPAGLVTPNAATSAPPSVIPLSGWTIRNGLIVNDALSNNIGLQIPYNASLNWRLYTRSLGGATTYTIVSTVYCGHPNNAVSSTTCGALYLYDGTKLEGFEVLESASGANNLRLETMTNVTTDSATLFGPTIDLATEQITVKVVEDTVHRTWSYWKNGAWVQALQENTNTFLTPTNAGPGGANLGTSAASAEYTEVRYWCQANTATIATTSTCI